MLGQGLAVAFQSSSGNTDSWAAQVGDALTALGNKVLRGQPANHCVVYANKRSIHSRYGTVNQYVRDLAALNLLEQPQTLRRLGRGDNKAIHLAGQQGLSLANL